MADCSTEQAALDAAVAALGPLLDTYLIDEAALEAAAANLEISDQQLANGISDVLYAEDALVQCETEQPLAQGRGGHDRHTNVLSAKLLARCLRSTIGAGQ